MVSPIESANVLRLSRLHSELSDVKMFCFTASDIPGDIYLDCNGESRKYDIKSNALKCHRGFNDTAVIDESLNGSSNIRLIHRVTFY